MTSHRLDERGAVEQLPGRASISWWWPAVLTVLALVPFVGALSTTRVFFVRDLGLYFWPRHLWFRESVANGDLPLWDPYAAGGQSAVADALNQFFLLPVTAIRAVLPPVVGFNFWIAAPFPLLAVGTWLWLRRRVSPAAAAAGAALMTVSGPSLSTGDFPNLSWTFAYVPWVLWSVDRLADRFTGRRFSTVALLVGLQGLSGEPVTSASTGALVVAYTAFAVGFPAWKDRLRAVLAAAAACIGGLLLAAVQIVPMVSAASRSMRGVNIDATFWSLHPLGLLELVIPHLFGHVYHGYVETLPWVRALNMGREPLLYSLYIGIVAISLACVRKAAAGSSAWRRFWWATLVVSLLCAFGEYTPLYPALQHIVPVLSSFRFPLKYFLITIVALVALTTEGIDALIAAGRGSTTIATPVAALGVLGLSTLVGTALGAGGMLGAGPVEGLWHRLAAALSMEKPHEAVIWLAGGNALWLRLVALSAATTVLIVLVWRQHAAARLAAGTLCVLAIADPVIVNSDLHPTIDASRLGPPEWAVVTQADPKDRVYVGGRIALRSGRQTGPPQLVDSPGMFNPPGDLSVQEAIMMYSIRFAPTPAAWRIRELVSYDLPQLWPREYVQLLRIFRGATPEARLLFLQRTAHRYCYLPQPPHPEAVELSSPPIARPMAMYECGDRPRRAYITPGALVEPALEDQMHLLFDAAHDPDSVVLLERPSPSAGGARGEGEAARAEIVSERQTEVLIRASVPAGGGYLNLLDTYDPNWVVEVDGQRQPLLRANAVFRAVHLQPGVHHVRFRYRPTSLYVGLAISGVTAIALLVLAFVRGGDIRADDDRG